MFKKDDTVIARRQMRNGSLIRMGTILRLDGDQALVNFPNDYVTTVIPTSQLEVATPSQAGGYKRANSVRRGKGYV